MLSTQPAHQIGPWYRMGVVWGLGPWFWLIDSVGSGPSTWGLEELLQSLILAGGGIVGTLGAWSWWVGAVWGGSILAGRYGAGPDPGQVGALNLIWPSDRLCTTHLIHGAKRLRATAIAPFLWKRNSFTLWMFLTQTRPQTSRHSHDPYWSYACSKGHI